MENIKGIIVLVMAISLMGILGLIVVDEFMMARENGGELDSNIIELLQMSITGIIGIVAGYVGAKSGSCNCKKQKETMREKIRMQSRESAHFYTRHKNKRLHPEKMTLNMYDPYIRKHCKYTEQKIKK